MALTSPTSPRHGTVPGFRLLVVRVLLAMAVGVDLYLAWVSLTGGTVAGCGPTSNCHSVLSSRWAYWFGIPVSLAALFVYLSLLVTTFALQRAASLTGQR